VAGRDLTPQVHNNFKATAPPAPGDDVTKGFQVGSRWIIKAALTEWSCRNNAQNAAVWVQVGAGGRPAGEDKGWIALATTADGQLASNSTISGIPLGATAVEVNGHGADVGDGVKTSACYFSGDGGLNARAINGVQNGDKLYWNGSFAAYELDSLDRIDVFYDIQ